MPIKKWIERETLEHGYLANGDLFQRGGGGA